MLEPMRDIWGEFQSTPSPRRETPSTVSRQIKQLEFQSTPSPRRETVDWGDIGEQLIFQSTPSPRRETEILKSMFHVVLFQSTPSPRRETRSKKEPAPAATISIHSLPKEGDLYALTAAVSERYFNPLPPQGGRHLVIGSLGSPD